MAAPLPPSVLAEIARLRTLYPEPRSALLPALHAAQAVAGCLTPSALEGVGGALGLPLAEVASVASFYEMFHLEPIGRHHIRICTNLSCYLNGCDPVLRRLCDRLGVRPGETTADGRVTVEAVQCLAACEEAPVLLVDRERHARVTPEGVDDLLAGLS